MFKYSINLNYFCQPLTPEASYFLGFLCADGNVNKNYIRLRLQEKDKDILEQLRASINYTGPLQYEKRRTLGNLVKNSICQNRYGLNFYSPKILGSLMALGFRDYPKLFTNSITKNNLPHFLRGLFDGDGTISLYFANSYPRFEIHLIGNSYLTKTVQSIFRDLGIKNSSIIDNGYAINNKRLVIRGAANARLYFDFIYQNDSISLSRKKNKFLELFALHNRAKQA